MALRHRRGVYTDFDPSKMVAGEIAVVQSGDPNTDSGQAVYACQVAGTAKRLVFVEDINGAIEFTDPNSNGNIVITIGGS